MSDYNERHYTVHVKEDFDLVCRSLINLFAKQGYINNPLNHSSHPVGTPLLSVTEHQGTTLAFRRLSIGYSLNSLIINTADCFIQKNTQATTIHIVQNGETSKNLFRWIFQQGIDYENSPHRHDLESRFKHYANNYIKDFQSNFTPTEQILIKTNPLVSTNTPSQILFTLNKTFDDFYKWAMATTKYEEIEFEEGKICLHRPSIFGNTNNKLITQLGTYLPAGGLPQDIGFSICFDGIELGASTEITATCNYSPLMPYFENKLAKIKLHSPEAKLPTKSTSSAEQSRTVSPPVKPDDDVALAEPLPIDPNDERLKTLDNPQDKQLIAYWNSRLQNSDILERMPKYTQVRSVTQRIYELRKRYPELLRKD